jgi:hypothetical protein
MGIILDSHSFLPAHKSQIRIEYLRQHVKISVLNQTDIVPFLTDSPSDHHPIAPDTAASRSVAAARAPGHSAP